MLDLADGGRARADTSGGEGINVIYISDSITMRTMNLSWYWQDN